MRAKIYRQLVGVIAATLIASAGTGFTALATDAVSSATVQQDDPSDSGATSEKSGRKKKSASDSTEDSGKTNRRPAKKSTADSAETGSSTNE